MRAWILERIAALLDKADEEQLSTVYIFIKSFLG